MKETSEIVEILLWDQNFKEDRFYLKYKIDIGGEDIIVDKTYRFSDFWAFILNIPGLRYRKVDVINTPFCEMMRRDFKTYDNSDRHIMEDLKKFIRVEKSL